MTGLQQTLLAALAITTVQGASHESTVPVNATSHVFTGYLADMLCTRLEIAPDAANMILAPETHTVGCELLPSCVQTGFGIVQNVGTGDDKLYRVATSFDESGNQFLVDLLRTMPTETNDLIVKVHGTFQGVNPESVTPSFKSRVNVDRFWPALNHVPIISLDSLQFCNYAGPDSDISLPEQCSTDNVLNLLAGDRLELENAGLCLRDELTVSSSDDDYYVLSFDGCADHATFRDVKRAEEATCTPADTTCETETCDKDTCVLGCIDSCGNALVNSSGKKIKSCCLDECGNPIVNERGLPFVDACGNPLDANQNQCPADDIGENQVNECLDSCGNPLQDVCGNPVTHCCLDVCGNPLVDPCGNPFTDACGNPASDENETPCTQSRIGMNDCLPSSDCEGGGCDIQCLDSCGNALSTMKGRTAKTCCVDACGNPYVDGCGFPFYDACGNPLTDKNSTCPANSIRENEVVECVDSCGNPFEDACGNPRERCCLDVCGNPIVDGCGNPFYDPCGNPAKDASGSLCPAADIGENSCDGSGGKSGGGSSWRVLAGHESGGGSGGGGQTNSGSCKAQCVDSCGNPVPKDTSRRPATTCCLDECGNPLLDGSGIPFYDVCGNPLSGDSGVACEPDRIGENELNQCIDSCGNPFEDACGNPRERCCLDVCGSPIVDGCGNPFYDSCGNPAKDANGSLCPVADIGENRCSVGDDSEECSGGALEMPPAHVSFQCEGLTTACQIALNVTNGTTSNILSGVPPSQRRRQARKDTHSSKHGVMRKRVNKPIVGSNGVSRRMQGEPSVPVYTPIRKDFQVKIPKTPTTFRVRKELDDKNDGVIGVAVNGVLIVHEHPGEMANTMLFDSCGGHGDISNRYHYHIPPICLLRALGGTVPRNSDWWLSPNPESQWASKARALGEKSPLIGWALDGHPIFGPYNPDNGELVVPSGGTGDSECTANQLDECNGMVLENRSYAYFITPTFPFVPPCLMGDVADDAFEDNGNKDELVEQCPFEGTSPLANTVICDEKIVRFQDDTCPGIEDRQAIRNCFEIASSTFVGEPTCSQLETAVASARTCFLDKGCCEDLGETLAAWKASYPLLENCTLEGASCPEFGDDNVVEVTMRVESSAQDFTPDKRAQLRTAVARYFEVDPSNIRITRVSDVGDGNQIDVRIEISSPSKDEAKKLQESLEIEQFSTALSDELSVPFSSAEAVHVLPPEVPPVPSVPELWSSENRLGLGLSSAAVFVLLGIAFYMEEFFCAAKPHDEELANKMENMESIENPDKDDQA